MKKMLLTTLLTTGLSLSSFALENVNKEVKMEFVTIQAGSFTMGSPEDEIGRSDNEAQRMVTITKDFEMMTTEVTQKMYFDVTGKNPSFFSVKEVCPKSFTVEVSPVTGKTVSLCPNHPVETVTFYDVQDFIKKLNEQTGLEHRLPTEAEWEYAARGGHYASAAYFGHDPKEATKYEVLDGNSLGEFPILQTHPVGPARSFANLSNPYGLFDMLGNVSEWVQDWYSDQPVGEYDPQGPVEGEEKVQKGYSAIHGRVSSGTRVAYRWKMVPENSSNGFGFRLVKTL